MMLRGCLENIIKSYRLFIKSPLLVHHKNLLTVGMEVVQKPTNVVDETSLPSHCISSRVYLGLCMDDMVFSSFFVPAYKFYF